MTNKKPILTGSYHNGLPIHTRPDFNDELVDNKDQKIASLNADKKHHISEINELAITDTFIVNSEGEMTSLEVQRGDVAIIRPLRRSFILRENDPSLLSNWEEIVSPLPPINTVFGREGHITAEFGDYSDSKISFGTYSLIPQGSVRTAILFLEDNKSPVGHLHSKSEITDFEHTHTKSEITDFAHTHVKNEITDFEHTHTKSEITDFAHTHVKNEITDFAHTHVKNEITDFAHTHVKNEITDFAHTHVKNEITDFAHMHEQSEIIDLLDDLSDIEGKILNIESMLKNITYKYHVDMHNTKNYVENGTITYPCKTLSKALIKIGNQFPSSPTNLVFEVNLNNGKYDSSTLSNLTLNQNTIINGNLSTLNYNISIPSGRFAEFNDCTFLGFVHVLGSVKFTNCKFLHNLNCGINSVVELVRCVSNNASFIISNTSYIKIDNCNFKSSSGRVIDDFSSRISINNSIIENNSSMHSAIVASGNIVYNILNSEILGIGSFPVSLNINSAISEKSIIHGIILNKNINVNETHVYISNVFRTNSSIEIFGSNIIFDDAQFVSFSGILNVNNVQDAVMHIKNTKSDSDHTHDLMALGAMSVLEKGAPHGVPILDDDGKIMDIFIPDIALVDIFEANSEAEMLTLSNAKQGDICIRYDTHETLILSSSNYGDILSWKQHLTAPPVIGSVFGRIGNVVAESGDYSAAQISFETSFGLGDNVQSAVEFINVNKADLGHTHAKSNIVDFEHSHSKSDIENFDNHNHLRAHIVNFNHTHPYHEISDFDGHTHIKAHITDFAHTHQLSELIDFENHTHIKSQITDFNHTHVKLEITDFAHTHIKAEITDFNHTHVKTEITDFVHTHLQSEITDFAHTHIKAEITDFAHTHTPEECFSIPMIEKNVANGVAGLDENLKLFISHLPNIEHPSIFIFGTEALMLSNVELKIGDFAAIFNASDFQNEEIPFKLYKLNSLPSNDISNWVELNPMDGFMFDFGNSSELILKYLDGSSSNSLFEGVSIKSLQFLFILFQVMFFFEMLGRRIEDLSALEISYDDVGGILNSANIQEAISSLISLKANVVHTHIKADITDFAHTHIKAEITDFAHTHTPEECISIPLSEKAQPLGVATLNSIGKLEQSQIPALAISDTVICASELEMLNSAVQKGDLCIRTDIGSTFILKEEPSTELLNWAEFLIPNNGVLTFKGRNGNVLPETNDYSASQIQYNDLVTGFGLVNVQNVLEYLNTNKSDMSHSHLIGEITDFDHTHLKSQITDFAHTHIKTDITDFAHNHPKSEIPDFAHTHELSELNDFEDHTHAKSQITDFVHNHTKSEILDFAHTHELSELTGFGLHNHTKSEITDFDHNHIKDDITDFAHNHIKAEITDFAHDHIKDDITDFAHTHELSELNGFNDHNHIKAHITDFAHTHVKTEITDFAHNHIKAHITDFAHTHIKTEITDFAHRHFAVDLDIDTTTFTSANTVQEALDVLFITKSNTNHSHLNDSNIGGPFALLNGNPLEPFSAAYINTPLYTIKQISEPINGFIPAVSGISIIEKSTGDLKDIVVRYVKTEGLIITDMADNVSSSHAIVKVTPGGELIRDPFTYSTVNHKHLSEDVLDFEHTHTKSEITNFEHTHENTDLNNVATLVSGKIPIEQIPLNLMSPVNSVFGRTGNIIAQSNDYEAEMIRLNSNFFQAHNVKNALEELFDNKAEYAGGPTLERPVNPRLYKHYFDSDLQVLIFWNGTEWVIVSPSPRTVLNASPSVNKSLPRFKGTSGLEIESSLVNVDDLGNVNIPENASIFIGSTNFRDLPSKKHIYNFDQAIWNEVELSPGEFIYRIIITPATHGLGSNDSLIVQVKDGNGDLVDLSINVSGTGIVTIVSDSRFDGKCIIA